MNKKPLTADAVLQVATALITANGSTTTHDVKKELRKEDYEAFQHDVSRIMLDLFGAGKLASTNDPSRAYQIYDLPKNGTASSTAAPLASGDIIKDLLQNGTPAQQDILVSLSTAKEVLRKSIAANHGDSKTDTALASLVKKGILQRIAPGVYAMNQISTPIQDTGKVAPVVSLSVDQKLSAALQVIEELKEKNQKLEGKLTKATQQLEEAHKELITN